MAKKKSNATRRAEQLAAAERAASIRKEQERAEQRRRRLVVTVAIAGVLALILGVGYAVQSARDTTGQAATPPAGVVDDYAVPRGEAGAPVVVTIYEDFMCPFCGDFEAASRDVLQPYVDRGDVQLQYRVVSFLDRASDGSDYSTRAMNALGVVLDTAGQEAAGRFHDALFEQQPEEGTSGLSDAELVDLAVQAGADADQVTGPIEDRSFEQWVQNATDAASRDDINSTPTVLVDGEVVEFETIDELVAGVRSGIEAGLEGATAD
jgi:protein-disulfide isomerase